MTPVLPALPAVIFAPEGETMTVDELRLRMFELGARDPEAAHSVEDEMLRRVLESIRDGHPDPAGLATAALTVASADYPRWCA